MAVYTRLNKYYFCFDCKSHIQCLKFSVFIKIIYFLNLSCIVHFLLYDSINRNETSETRLLWTPCSVLCEYFNTLMSVHQLALFIYAWYHTQTIDQSNWLLRLSMYSSLPFIIRLSLFALAFCTVHSTTHKTIFNSAPLKHDRLGWYSKQMLHLQWRPKMATLSLWRHYSRESQLGREFPWVAC